MFDVSARQACKVRPSVTSTPLHALTTLNDPTWSEAARVLAELALKSSPDVAARIHFAFRRILARPPSPNDTAILSRAWQKQLDLYNQNPTAAESLLKIGAAPRDTSLPTTEHAAMTAVCLALLNRDEARTRE
jgi:hypothetical protein